MHHTQLSCRSNIVQPAGQVDFKLIKRNAITVISVLGSCGVRRINVFGVMSCPLQLAPVDCSGTSMWNIASRRMNMPGKHILDGFNSKVVTQGS